jgi:hypothetical protein
LVPTFISVHEDEYYDVLPESRVPAYNRRGFLLHGLDLRPGPFDCGRADQNHERGIRPGIDLEHPDPLVGADPHTLATFKLGDQRVDIAADKVNGKFRLLMQYGGRTQVLYEAGPMKMRYLQADLVCDLDRDGKPDVIVTLHGTGGGWGGTHARLYLSRTAAPGELVRQVAGY